MVYTAQDEVEALEGMITDHRNNAGWESQLDAFGNVGTVDASDLVCDEAGPVSTKADNVFYIFAGTSCVVCVETFNAFFIFLHACPHSWFRRQHSSKRRFWPVVCPFSATR